jgi:hypothetical protein
MSYRSSFSAWKNFDYGGTSMRIKAILCALLVVAPLSIFIGHANCGSSPQNTLLTDIFVLYSIEVRLAWEPQFDSIGLLDLIIKRFYAALPPGYQPHYKPTADILKNKELLILNNKV